MLSGHIIVFANLKPRKLADIMSAGMVLCASNTDHTKIELVRPADGAKVGDRVQLAGNKWKNEPLPSDYQTVLNPKKKIEVGVLGLLKTDSDCFA